MAELLERIWSPAETGLDHHLPAPSGGKYEPYLLDTLTNREFFLSGATTSRVVEAEAALAELARHATPAARWMLRRIEATASTKISGLQVPASRLVRAEAATLLNDPRPPGAAVEAANTVAAIDLAAAVASGEITPREVLGIHRAALGGSCARGAGKVRAGEAWLGGTAGSPVGALYVGPPPEFVEGLLADLCAFASGSALPPVAHAAVVHAQLDAIRPFADGNGRVGRALVHAVLSGRGAGGGLVAPVSAVFAADQASYFDSLAMFCHLGDPHDTPAVRALDAWVGFFAEAVTQACAEALCLVEHHLVVLNESWRERVGRVRSGSATELVLDALPGMPVFDVDLVIERVGRSDVAVGQALAKLESAGVIHPTKSGHRNRVWDCPEVISLLHSATS